MAYTPPAEYPYVNDSAPGAADGDIVYAEIPNHIMAYLQDELPIDIAAAAGTSLDHGTQLTGLLDDDHTQYALADGTRGTFEAAGAVAAHTGDTSDAHDASAISIGTLDGNLVAVSGTDVEQALQAIDNLSLGGTYTDENARDAIATALTAGTGITVTPNDGADTITVATTITQYTDELARDAIGTALVAGGGVSVTVNDGSDTITIASTVDELQVALLTQVYGG